MPRIYVNNFSTTLSAAIVSTGATSITITSATGLPTLSTGEYYLLTIDDSTNREIVKVTSRSGTTLTIVRAQEGTTANTFVNGTAIEMRDTAASYNNIDDVGNFYTNNYHEGYTTTATAAGTTTLTVSSTGLQYFTGSTTQTVVLPVTSTLTLGHKFKVKNLSSGSVTVQSSGANSVQVIAGGNSAIFTCIILLGTTAASWSVEYFTAAGGLTPWTSDISTGGYTLANDANANGVFIRGSTTGNNPITLTCSYLDIKRPSGTASGSIFYMYEAPTSGTDFIGFTAPVSVTASYTITLPATGGSGANFITTSGNTWSYTSMGANVAAWITSPTSANLATAVSDETGSGALVFATSPTLVTPALGTPASGTMTNVTGLPLTTGVTGTLAVTNGGTGRATSTTAYGLIAAGTTATGVQQTISPGTSGLPLISAGASALASFAQLSLTAGVTGVLPVANGGLSSAGRFSVYRNAAQSIASSTFTKVLFDAATEDVSGWFDITTNNRFTPLLAGTYLFLGAVQINSMDDQKWMVVQLSKNGSALQRFNTSYASGISNQTVSAAGFTSMNGSTDYIEMQVYQEDIVSRSIQTGAAFTYLTGIRIGPV